VDKDDCITVAQAFYEQAEATWRRAKQSVPQEFKRVTSSLDELCGEEEFEKARISIDWMNACLQEVAKDAKSDACSRSKQYFCAIDARSEACLKE